MSGVEVFKKNLPDTVVYYVFDHPNPSDFLNEAVEIFSEEIGIKLVVTKDKSGKPWLDNEYYVSFTHTKGLVVCAIGKVKLGIDAEQIRFVRYDGIARRKFTEKDASEVIDLNTFFKMWTRYEARFKLDNSLLTSGILYEEIDMGERYMVTLARVGL